MVKGMTGELERDVLNLPTGPATYWVAGTGHDVVYLHPAAGMRFSDPLRRLVRRFRVWAPIVPGFDATPAHDEVASMPALADLLAAFIEAGPGRPVDLVGSSLGGWLGAWLAVRRPGLVEHLVLAAPAGFRPAGAPPLSFEPEIMRAQLYAHPERVPPDDKSMEMRNANAEAVARYGAGNSHDPALQERVAEIACQTLILHGTLDVRVPAAGVQMLKKRIPNSQLVYVYDAAHGLELDQPDRVGALIEDFLVRGEAFIVNQTIAEISGTAAGTGA